MIYTIRIRNKSARDPTGDELLSEIIRTLKIKSIKKILTSKVYRVEGLRETEARKLSEVLLFEPINQEMSFNKPFLKKSGIRVEVAYKPGVMNPESASIIKSAEDIGIKIKAADSSREYFFLGKISKNQLALIIKRLLVNETVEQLIEQNPKSLLITAKTPTTKRVPIRNYSDKKLQELSKDRLFLNLEEMRVIRNYFKKIKRNPTDCEIETIAQTWSEHCVHKTFKAKLEIDGKSKKPLFDRIKKTIKFNPKIIVSSFEDNSGVIDFYDGWALNGKVETHNSPSAIEPYGGAMTGSGGVFRDILGTGKGAKPIASTDIFCFAPPNLKTSSLPLGCLPPDYLLRKVVAGVRDYGNRVGIPTNNGSIHFHKDFRAKPTVAVGSYGIIPKNKAKKGRAKKGELIITIGGRTGRDGIHGATFSSSEMTSKTITISGSAVQIGNAIEEKRVIDLVLALGEKNLINAITDCGAGGYSSAIGEMGENIGATINLEKVPLKYSGLAPWEIFLSESQERMVIAVSHKNTKKVLKTAKLYNVEATVIGKFDGSNKLKVFYKNKNVCNLDMKFLHNGLPQRKMIGKTKDRIFAEKLPKASLDLKKILFKVLCHGNVCSKEPIVRMYDHNVQGSSALHPFGGKNFNAPNDGVVLKPILKKPYGFITAHGLNPVLNTIDPYWGSIWAITEAVSNYVSIGGKLKDAALIDNFIWPYPDKESLADLDKSVDACYDMAKILRMPFVSGKDSLSSTYRYLDGKTLKIPPVILISVFGKIANVAKTQSSDFKKVKSKIVLVGRGDYKNLGGTTYFDVTKSSSSSVPKPDLKFLKRVFKSISGGIISGEIFACHDISEGGLAVSLFEMCLGASTGAKIDLSQIDKNIRADFILFSETPGTFLAEVEDEKAAKKVFKETPYKIIGTTQKDNVIEISLNKKLLIKEEISSLEKIWLNPMEEIFHK